MSDLNTTSVALMVTSPEPWIVNEVMDEMLQVGILSAVHSFSYTHELQYVNANGIIQTYFDETRCRIDPVVCVSKIH
jgi:hypothetical protein